MKPSFLIITPPERQSQPGDRLRAVATIAAMLCLLVSPFRGSAGLRGGLLLLAVAFALLAAWRSRDWKAFWPADKPALFAAGIWATMTLLWAVLGPDAAGAVGEWKRDVVTPLLAFLAFYALTNRREDLVKWFSMLGIGMVGLTALIFTDPLNRFDGNVQTPYGGVGALSTWLIILAALWPLAWVLLRERGLTVRGFTLAFLPLTMFCAYLTGNRIIWICFAIMLTLFAIHVAMTRYSLHMSRAAAGAMTVCGTILFAALAYFSSHMRFDVVPNQRVDVIETAVQDPRPKIWRESVDVLANNLVAGLGYGIDGMKAALVARFRDPALAERYGHGHNLLLNYGLQMGVAGIALMLAVMSALALAFRRLAASEDMGDMGAVGSICGIMLLAGFLGRNMTDDFFHRHSAILFWAATGMLLAIRKFKQSQSDDAAPNPHPAP